MSQERELIVLFVRGTPEDGAKQVVRDVGASVRRRMRSDHEDQVMLLVRVSQDDLDKAHKKLVVHSQVVHVEVNGSDYSI